MSRPSTFLSHCTILYSQWKRISCKQNARWQHLSRLKANAYYSLEKTKLVVMKHYNLYLGFVTPFMTDGALLGVNQDVFRS
jgi:lipopolysaccharide biosynthesis glycosyltransferase